MKSVNYIQVLALFMACAAGPVLAQDNWLVSADEALKFEGEAGFMAQPGLRARSVMPLIDILQPESVPDGKLKAPFAISVAFRPQNDAPIDVSSFKVLYGGLKFDITSRLTQYTQVNAEGFKLDKANIPKGKHRLTLQIQDAKQRLAERELRIEVE
jgi:hypothetical protein